MKRRTKEDLCLELGWWEGEKFHIKNHCLDLLKAIEEELGCEDPILHTTRKLITSSKAIQNDILPVLIHSQENPCIFRAVLRVLLRLTTPVECLIPMELALQSKTAKEAIQNLHRLLLETKRSFLDVRSTETIMRVLKAKMKTVRLVEKLGNLWDQEPKDLTENDLEGLSNSLVLMRNLLHVPDKTESSRFGITENTYEDWLSVHNKLIWNLFVHGLDGVLILMLNSVYKVNWAVVVVQIIALLYKDQDVGNLQHLISNSTSTSESSEDDIESNTSKHSVHHASSNDSMQPAQPCGGPGAAKGGSGGVGGANMTGGGGGVGLPTTAGGPASTAGDSGYCQSDFTSSSNNSRSFSPRDKGELSRDQSSSSGRASADNMTSSSNGQSSSSDEDNQVKEHIKDPHHKASAKHRAMHSADSPSGSDSSYEDELLARSKQRNLVVMSRKSKSQLKGGKCTPSVCLEAAVASLESRSTLRDPVWDRKKTLVLLDASAHVPSNDDISNMLQSFTISFLHSGYGSLVTELMRVNHEQGSSLIDRCHFLWVVGYFTGLATALGLSLHHVRPVLSVEVVGLLIFEAIAVCQELDLAQHQSAEGSKLLKKRYHLVVRAFREFIAAIGTYNSRCKGVGDDMRRLCVSLARLEDLRNIPLLLIRKWNAMPSQVLVDLIITNHLLLLILEYAQKTEGGLDIDILGHLSQFATVEVMERYGVVLKDYRTNSVLVNDCVFTMMHHVAGDLKRPEALFHPNILSSFVNILNEGAEIPELYEDLVGYVMNRYLKLAGRNPELYSERIPGMRRSGSASSTQPLVVPPFYDDDSSDSSDCSDEGDDNALYWCFLQFEYDSDPVGQIVEHLRRNDVRRTRREILDQLKFKRVISNTQCEKLEEKEKQFLENSARPKEQPETQDIDNEERSEITDLVLKLKGMGYEPQLQWIQKKFLEVCYVKLKNRPLEDAEPVALHYTMLGQSVPIVAFSEMQSSALKNTDFRQLLHKLGLDWPGPAHCPCIPASWASDKLYATARKLGPLSSRKLAKLCHGTDNNALVAAAATPRGSTTDDAEGT